MVALGDPVMGLNLRFSRLVDHHRRVGRGQLPVPPLQAAKHDGAHAVVAVLVDGRFDEVVVLHDDARSNRPAAQLRGLRFTGPDRLDDHRGGAVAWAGALAEGHLCHSRDDMEEIERHYGTLQRSGKAFAMSARLVNEFMPAIDLVANQLTERGQLSYDDVELLVRSWAASQQP